MGRLVILTLTCSVLLFAALNVADANDVRINWARNSRLKLLPSNIVDMILSNGVKKVRLHSFVGSVARAFTGSGLELTTTVANIDMILVNTTRKAQAYVAENVTKAYTNLDLKVKNIIVGNEPFTIVDNITKLYQDDVVNAIGYLTDSLAKQPCPINQIKATMAHAPDVLTRDIQKPSDANFNDDVNDRMVRVLKVLNGSGAPLSVNMYPHLHLVEKNFPLEFAFFDNNSTFTVKDGENETAYDVSLTDDSWFQEYFKIISGNISTTWERLDAEDLLTLLKWKWCLYHSFELESRVKTVFYATPAVMRFCVPAKVALQEAYSTPLLPLDLLADKPVEKKFDLTKGYGIEYPDMLLIRLEKYQRTNFTEVYELLQTALREDFVRLRL